MDTARVLAADAVQKVGNGHPGTAMSMAPTAYLLFQKWLRHDPSDPNWVGRDRFVLSMGHSSLTLYIQLYLSGYGLELSDLQAQRTETAKRLELLTPRERQVLELLVEGLPSKLVAHRLEISTRTAEHHRAAVMKKMEARTLSHLVRMALELQQSEPA